MTRSHALASALVASLWLWVGCGGSTRAPTLVGDTPRPPLVQRDLAFGLPPCEAPPCLVAEGLSYAPRWTLTAWVYGEADAGPVVSTPRWSLAFEGAALVVRAPGGARAPVQVDYPGGWRSVALVADGPRWRLCVDDECREGPRPDDAGPGPALSVGASPGRAARIASVRVLDEALSNPSAGPRPERFEVPVYEATEAHCYRIPAIVAHGSSLLAFAERRHGYGRNRCSDHGNIDLVMRRSDDGGWTWGPLQVVVEHTQYLRGGHAIVSTSSPVVDAEGTLRLLYAVTRDTDGQGNAEGRVHRGDEGVERLAFAARVTFENGEPRVDAHEITDVIRGDDRRWFAFGPGHGIRLEHGPCAGRLVVPGYFDAVGRSGAHGFATVFVDDTSSSCGEPGWRRGGVTRGPLGELSSESQVAERADGTLWLSSRRVGSDPDATRRVAISGDAGATWHPSTQHPALVDPVAHGSVIGVGDRLVHSNPACRANTRRDDRLWRFRMRRWMTVSMSPDGGETWPWRRVLREGSAGYSDLVDLEGDALGLLYEAPMAVEHETPADPGDPGWYENGINFVRFDREWIRSAPPFTACDERRFGSHPPSPPAPTESDR